MTDAEMIDRVLQREGGFVDNPADKGGPTNFGITAATLGDSRRLGRIATADEVKALTVEEARAILLNRYIIKPGYDGIASEVLRACIVDAAVNHGPMVSTRLLQHVLGVREDGVLGPQTLGTLNLLDGLKTARRFLAERVRFYGRLISGRPSQATFAAGWLNRAADQFDELA